MSRRCLACGSERRQEIDAALLRHSASYRRLGARYGVDERSLRRHERQHLAAAVRKAQEERLMHDAEQLAAELDAELDALLARARRVMDRAEAAADDRTVLLGAETYGRTVERIARLGLLAEHEHRIAAQAQAAARLYSPAYHAPQPGDHDYDWDAAHRYWTEDAPVHKPYTDPAALQDWERGWQQHRRLCPLCAADPPDQPTYLYPLEDRHHD